MSVVERDVNAWYEYEPEPLEAERPVEKFSKHEDYVELEYYALMGVSGGDEPRQVRAFAREVRPDGEAPRAGGDRTDWM